MTTADLKPTSIILCLALFQGCAPSANWRQMFIAQVEATVKTSVHSEVATMITLSATTEQADKIVHYDFSSLSLLLGGVLGIFFCYLFLRRKQMIKKFLEGKKTYIVAIATLIGGILVSQGIAIPEYVWAILAALGLGAVRAGIPQKK